MEYGYNYTFGCLTTMIIIRNDEELETQFEIKTFHISHDSIFLTILLKICEELGEHHIVVVDCRCVRNIFNLFIYFFSLVKY